MIARRARPAGFALIAAIAALAVIEILAIGLITLSARARTATEERAARVAARTVAESAVRRAVALWDERVVGFPRPGSRFTVSWATGTTATGVAFAVDAERLHRGILLIQGRAWTAAGPAGARAAAAATVTTIPSDEARLDFHSAIVAGGDFTLLDGALVDGSTPAVPPAPLQTADCIDPGPAPPVPAGSARPGIALATGATLVVQPGATVAGSPGLLPNSVRAAPASFTRFGRLPLSDIAAIADRIETGSVHLAPRAAGAACDTAAPANWGTPASRAHPCFDWVPLVYAPGDLTIAGGDGQAVLVVDGDLTIAAGVRLSGVVLVTGRLDAGPNARIDGAVRVAGSGSRSAATVHFDECALARAFTLSPALRKVYRISDRWWLPAW